MQKVPFTGHPVPFSGHARNCSVNLGILGIRKRCPRENVTDPNNPAQNAFLIVKIL